MLYGCRSTYLMDIVHTLSDSRELSTCRVDQSVAFSPRPLYAKHQSIHSSTSPKTDEGGGSLMQLRISGLSRLKERKGMMTRRVGRLTNCAAALILGGCGMTQIRATCSLTDPIMGFNPLRKKKKKRKKKQVEVAVLCQPHVVPRSHDYQLGHKTWPA